MRNDNGDVFVYSNKQWLRETKRLIYKEKLDKYREKNGIFEIEKSMNDYNSKSCNLKEFKEYITMKNKTNKILFGKYNADIFRRHKWYAYINKQRAIANLINSIKAKFGENCKIIMGDWSVPKQMKNFISTPMIGLKRAIAKEIEVFNLDEYNTSKINCITGEENDNLRLWIEKKKKTNRKIIKCKGHKHKQKSEIKKKIALEKEAQNDLTKDNLTKNEDETVIPIREYGYYKIHSILTYKMENGRLGCINRDKNSVNNMKKIVDYWFKNKDRPEKYKRSTNNANTEKTTKDRNPVGVKCGRAPKGSIT